MSHRNPSRRKRAGPRRREPARRVGRRGSDLNRATDHGSILEKPRREFEWWFVRIALGVIMLCMGGCGTIFAILHIHYEGRLAGHKVRTEHARIGKALESYFDTHGAYPNGIPMNAKGNRQKDPAPLMTVDLDAIGVVPESKGELTVKGDKSYAGKYDYRDWFTARWYHYAALPYRYFPKDDGWILISTGPDGDYDIDPESGYDPNIPQPSPHLMALAGTYDPTNGTESDGDLWRVKQ